MSSTIFPPQQPPPMPPPPPIQPSAQPPYSPYVPPSGTLLQAVRGPLMMITLGALLAFDSMGGPTWSHTWPVMLIVYGLLKLAERAQGTTYAVNS